MRFLAIFLGFLPFALNYRILGLFAFRGKSHFVLFERLFLELTERGHYVDVLGHFPLEKSVNRYKDISVSGSVPPITSFSVDYLLNMNLDDTINLMIDECGTGHCEKVFSTKQAQDLRNSTTKYDLIIVEIFGSDCMLGFAHLFHVPVVAITTSVNVPWGGDRFANPDNPSYIPNYFVAYPSHMNLWQRIYNTLTLIYAKVKYEMIAVPQTDALMKQFFGRDIPSVKELEKNISLLLVNSHFSTNGVRPTVPNFIEIGGLHIKPVRPLPQRLEEIMSVAGSKYKGVIYLSFGSIVQTETFAFDKLQTLMDSFKDLPYKVVWKANKTALPGNVAIPENIYFEAWTPQLDILCHPNTRLFISHGGLMGTQEAIYCGVPRVGVPIFADQHLNIRQSVAMGIAIEVPFAQIDSLTIFNAAKIILEDPSYKQRAEKVANLFRDRPSTALETAIYWIEYAIRHNGAPELRSAATDLYWFQYYLIDVAAIILTCVLSFAYLCCCLIRLLWWNVSFKKRGKID